ncbi:hypothetical protein BD779DRAFT_1099932 [Infundibulicybe gibba]|nr:hypothetical protein BD779DRAFT_1099932 [Infundibulicybe gibba]
MELPLRVAVDDANPQIQYSSIGQWTLLIGDPPRSDVADPANGPPFQNTTHFTNATSSLSLQFRGSQPQVFGTSMSVHYECFVDDTSFGPILEDGYVPMNNVVLCDGTPFFEAKEYTLTLNITHEDGMHFYFDYITYIPSTSDPLGSATVLVDKLDSAIVYSTAGDWLPGILPGQVIGQADSPTPSNTGSFAHASGSSLTFNFTGASVSWVGYIPAQMTSSQSTSNAIYSIDNAKPVPFRIHASDQNISNQVLFKSPTLNPGPHSLKVTHQGNATTPPLVLDHFVVSGPTPSLQGSPVASASLQPPSTSSAVATSTNKPSTSVPIGAIVGGAVGGIAVLCLTAFLLWRYIRQKRFHDNSAAPPYLLPFDATSSVPPAAEAGNRTLKAHRFPIVDPPGLNPDKPSGLDDPDAAPQVENFNQRDPPLRTPSMETVHEDRGARSVTDGVADPPPSYVSQ